MSMIKTLCLVSLAAALLTGCLSGGGGGSGGSNNNGGGGDVGGGDPGGMPVSFTTLVKDLFASTSDTAEPRAINELAITYDDQDNEGAFDDLLGEP